MNTSNRLSKSFDEKHCILLNRIVLRSARSYRDYPDISDCKISPYVKGTPYRKAWEIGKTFVGPIEKEN